MMTVAEQGLLVIGVAATLGKLVNICRYLTDDQRAFVRDPLRDAADEVDLDPG
jgi:hypothetical protein